MRREVLEETGLTVTQYAYRGIVTFVSDVYPTEYMHLFTCSGFTGDLKECDEGELEWIDKVRLFDRLGDAGNGAEVHADAGEMVHVHGILREHTSRMIVVLLSLLLSRPPAPSVASGDSSLPEGAFSYTVRF